ncbi:MAG: hypothetical protein ACI89L_001592 [Phycisphaerales bacterium]|jgi:hypothetical protein
MPTETTSMYLQSLLPAAKLGVGFGEMLAKDIPADKFARFITNGGQPIVANHPAYAIGHLAIYPAKIAGFLGADTSKFAQMEKWTPVLEQDIECHDDADGSIYPSKDAIMDAYVSGYAGIVEIVASTDESVFAQENPFEKARDRFPTVGVMTNFMLTSHIMFHLGQVSTWRRCNGLGSVM